MKGVPFSPPAPSPDPRPGRAPRVRRHLGRLLVAIGAVALSACDDSNALEVIRVVGALELDSHLQPRIPGTMTAGVPSEITFWTSGDSCVEGGGTEVDITGDLALVTPYDFVTMGGGCLELLQFFEHRAKVVFDEPGTAEIVIVYSGNGGYVRQYGTRVYTVEVSQ